MSNIQKHLWIISSNDNNIGTEKDVENYKKFFTSPFGGCWDREKEITVIYEDDFLDPQIITAQILKYDYLICIFTGHGLWDGETTRLRIGRQFINESYLTNCAHRQLTIIDCCRKYCDLRAFEKTASLLTEEFAGEFDKDQIRDEYDQLITQTPPYQCCMHACSPGECAWGNKYIGGLFSYNLINQGLKLVKKGVPCRLGKVFESTREMCMQRSMKKYRLCPTTVLIFGKSV